MIFFYISYFPYASFFSTVHYHRMASVRISQKRTVVRRHYHSNPHDRTILGVISFFTHYAVDTSCLIIHSPYCRFKKTTYAASHYQFEKVHDFFFCYYLSKIVKWLNKTPYSIYIHCSVFILYLYINWEWDNILIII